MRRGRLVAIPDEDITIAVKRTTNAWERARGQLLRPPPPPGEGLMIVPCASVHMFGMRYALDVIYLSPDGIVIRIVSGLRPGRMSMQRGAASVVEMAEGEAERVGMRVGQVYAWADDALVGPFTAGTPA